MTEHDRRGIRALPTEEQAEIRANAKAMSPTRRARQAAISSAFDEWTRAHEDEPGFDPAQPTADQADDYDRRVRAALGE